MKRNDFIKEFNLYLKTLNNIENYERREMLLISMDLMEKESPNTKLNYIKSIFEPFLINNKINNFDFLNNSLIESEFDEDYAEENPDSNIWRYWAKLNLNNIYDNLGKQEYSNTNINKIYRVESKKNESGMYANGATIAKLILNSKEETTPAPENDILLNHIFSNDLYANSKYKKEWFFGFQSIEDAKKWLNNDSIIELMIVSGNCLVEYAVPESFIIFGEKQLIFKKEQSKVLNKLELKILLNKKNQQNIEHKVKT